MNRTNTCQHSSSSISLCSPPARSARFFSQQNGQMIALLGVMLAISVFVISTIPSELSDQGPMVIKERSTSLLPEFLHLREMFGHALQYSLVNISFNESIVPPSPHMIFYGRHGKYTMQSSIIGSKIITIKERISNFLNKQNKLFYASGGTPYYSHSTEEGDVYYVPVRLVLRDGYSRIEQTVRYTIICNEHLI